MCFVWISEKQRLFPLYNINGMVCIMEKESVYCAVRAESLHIIQVNLSFSKVRVTAGGRESNPMVQHRGHCAVYISTAETRHV